MSNEFGRQLKLWRKRLKLSQQALCLEADISTKHLSQLETGKALPSRQMVDRICSCLSLSSVDSSMLLCAAGFAGDADIGAHHQEIGMALQLIADGHEPNPGIIANIYLEPKIMTAGAIKLLRWLELDIASFKSSMDFLLSSSGLRRYMVDWHHTIKISFNLIKAQLPADSGNSPFEKSIKQVLRDVELKKLWDSCTENHSDMLPVIPLTLEKDGVTLRFTLLISTFGLPKHIHLVEDEYQLDFFYPLDDETRDFMIDLCR